MNDLPYFDIGPAEPAAPAPDPEWLVLLRELVRDGARRFGDIGNEDWRRLCIGYIAWHGFLEALCEAATEGEEARMARHLHSAAHAGLRADHQRQLGETVCGALERWVAAQLADALREELQRERERLEGMEEDAAEMRMELRREETGR